MTVHKNNEIISNFYLIRNNNWPTYVGYTNRSIKQRFTEHLHDKDFGDGKVSVESLGSMSFDFTWDITLINQYAKEVSDRETELITEYGTATSDWQKGLNGNIGGQTWANVKNFISTNRNNPKFADMDDSEILAYLDEDRVIKIYMQSFVNNANDPVKIYMGNFVGGIDDPVKIYMQSFVNNVNEPVKIYMNHFVSAINDPVKIYMGNFVGGIDDPVKIYMQSFVNNVNEPVKIYMRDFVNNAKDPVKIYMNHFVSHIDDLVKIYMQSFVSNMKNKQ